MRLRKILKKADGAAFFLTDLRLCTGANIAGFVKVAEAMIAQGLV